MTDVRQGLLAALPPEMVPDVGDLRGRAVGGRVPEAVLEPATADEVRQALLVAAGRGLAVVPVGGATHTGPQAPDRPFALLSTRRLSEVEDYEPADLTVTVGAGCLLEALDNTLRAQGQWLPVDPPLAPRRTVGGVVATGTAGTLGMAYGLPRDHVLGLTVVSGDGQILRLGGRVMKNVAGFDLVKLMVGSRGTLGVIVSASLRLFPVPVTDRAVVLTAATPGELLATARRVATAQVVPAAAVLLSPGTDGGASLVVRVQGAAAAVDADARTLLGDELARATVMDGGEARDVLGAMRDHASPAPLVLRAFALPALLPEVLAAMNECAPDADVAADVMAGRVRAGVTNPDDVHPSDVHRLRSRVERLGGSVVVERAPPRWVDSAPAYGATSGDALGAALRRRFDPEGVLCPGMFQG